MRALLLGLAATSWIARRPPPRSTIGASRAVLMAAVSKKPKFPTRRPLLPKSIDWNGAAKQHSVRAAPPELPAPFTVLGIETSCDDTGVAVVRSDGTILGEALASQAELHEEWGGVMPSVARDAHAEALERTAAEALHRAGMSSAAEVDAIAVTVGPGLEICLRVGCARLLLCLRQAYICTTTTTLSISGRCEHAKALAVQHQKPFVAVHHLEAQPASASRLAHESPVAPPHCLSDPPAHASAGARAHGAPSLRRAAPLPLPDLTRLRRALPAPPQP